MKYSIDKHLMDKIDTEEKAYWLGFFYADAYNNEKLGRIVIELAAKDEEHLLKCANFFGNPRKPFRQIKNRGKYEAYRLELNSRHLSNILAEKGCPKTKSFIIKFPIWLDQQLIKHFIRGYFDGDGSISVHSNQNFLDVCIVSTKEMNQYIQHILKTSLDINSQIRFRDRYLDNTCVLTFGGNKQVLRFCEWIYKDATIYLDRKHEVYTSFNNKYQQLVDARSKTKLGKWWPKELKARLFPSA